jgi:hypothetical protein
MVRPTTTLIETTGPEASPFGILSPATTVVERHDDYWISSFDYEIADAQVKVDNAVILGASTPSEIVSIVPNTGHTYGKYYPFDIEAEVEHSTLGTTPEEIEAKAKKALDIVSQKAIETEFWNGGIAKLLTESNDNRYLASTNSVDVTPTPGTAVKPRYGLALLEGALGNATIGSIGTIHAPRAVAGVLKLEQDNSTLFTKLGNTVVAGTGYSKIGPTGVAAGANQYWLYATGPVTVLLGDMVITPEKVSQAIDTRVNTIKYYVDRPAAVTWSTSNVYAVLVDLTLDYA